MKLNFIFIVMDLLTILAYPVVFVHGKLRQSLKSKENAAPKKLLATDSTVAGR